MTLLLITSVQVCINRAWLQVGLLLCTDCIECEAKSEGLVCYPATQAPVSGSVIVTTQCATP